MLLAMGTLTILAILSLALYASAAVRYRWGLRVHLILGGALVSGSGIAYLVGDSFFSRRFAVAALFVLAIGLIGKVLSDARSKHESSIRRS